MDKKQIVEAIIGALGGAENIVCITNCMTRLRAVVKKEESVKEERLKSTPSVLGLVHDRAYAYEVVVGPGNSRQYADICRESGIKNAADGDWKQNKAAIKAGQKTGRLRNELKTVGDIFVPLIPGILTAGLCAGFASLITQLVPDYKSIRLWYIAYLLLSMINVSFMTYITAWAGYRAAERFGATPILGGMLGMITSLSSLDDIARQLGLYNEEVPLDSILKSGKGGVLAVIAGVFVLALMEKFIRKRMPASLDTVFTPFITLIACMLPYIFVIMPLFGLLSSGIVWVFGKLCMSQSLIVRIIVGFAAAALFLPLVATGMHHGLVALYTVQLQEIGYITLFPVLCMAGAGQVGAAIAIYIKAKRLKHKKLCSVITGALPAGLMGVGEPLIYGVTLPMGSPFVTAGIGAGFGGAFVMAFRVASTLWGVTGIPGVFIMTAGEGGAVKSMVIYLAGLFISYVMGYIITAVFIKNSTVAAALGGIESEVKPETIPEVKPCPHISVKHGDAVSFGFGSALSFEHTIADPLGIHARPAGELAGLVSKLGCDASIQCEGKTASCKSVIELMLLGAAQGSRLTVSVRGGNAKQALEEIKRFMEEKL